MTLRVEWLRGCGTALVTPFTATGAVDEARFRALLERQIAGGVRLLVPCGTTGEGATLDAREHEGLITLAVEVAGRGRRARVIAGVGSNATAVTIERARAARGAGADAILVVAPYYNKPTQAGLVAHFRAVAEAVEDLPVVLYNVPGRTASNITAATTLTLARERANIVGTKEASGDLSQIMAILRDRPPNFCVLSGDDAMTLPLMALGADGVVSVASNEVPDAMARLTDLALRDDWAAARTLHYRLLPLMEANFIESNPGPVKAALVARGEVRAAERTSTGAWCVNTWVKRGILLGFRIGALVEMPAAAGSRFFDKDTYPLRPTTLADRVRIVPGGSSIRDGAYVAPGVVCMPPMYVNVGAYVDEGVMIDSHVLVGSCAQIGGVLEPIGALPVIVEEDVLVGGGCGIYEGTIVRRRAVLAAGTILTGSTAVYDVVREQIYRRSGEGPLEIPSGAVVVPGARVVPGAAAARWGLSLYTPVIIKYRDEKTDAATLLEADLR